MVIGAQVDVFVGMFAEGLVDIHWFHTGGQMADDIVDGGALRTGAVLHLFRTIELDSRRNHHAIDIHRGEAVFVDVGSLRVACTAIGRSAVGHQRTHLVARADDDDTGIGDLCVLVGGHMVLVAIRV